MARENLHLDEEYGDLDIQATKLWSLATCPSRASGEGNNGETASQNKRNLNGSLYLPTTDWRILNLQSPPISLFYARMFTPLSRPFG